jgi:hypothetical protein
MNKEPPIECGASVRLCASCEKIVLRDDEDSGFLVVHDEHGKPHHVSTAADTQIMTDFWMKDTFPDLHGLHESSRYCTFCQFLRDVLSSEEGSTALKSEMHSSSTTSSIEIELLVSFEWNCANTNEHQYLVLNVTLDGSRDVNFYCTIQTSDGTVDIHVEELD